MEIPEGDLYTIQMDKKTFIKFQKWTQKLLAERVYHRNYQRIKAGVKKPHAEEILKKTLPYNYKILEVNTIQTHTETVPVPFGVHPLNVQVHPLFGQAPITHVMTA
jgi:hypothetical protein